MSSMSLIARKEPSREVGGVMGGLWREGGERVEKEGGRERERGREKERDEIRRGEEGRREKVRGKEESEEGLEEVSFRICMIRNQVHMYIPCIHSDTISELPKS